MYHALGRSLKQKCVDIALTISPKWILMCLRENVMFLKNVTKLQMAALILGILTEL